ncbi:hypothetical protein HK099_006509 [Clydaea vesicula]|uniref:SprT-like domain-containing protein n=1 Tax=Clydaea vesicula TaxID=447962 RepID=A0AAD5XU83_9FUNG|nr:hypothetical protein HK099_006509 [Clydaea vesicula]KAJ3381645.1 hypothetical protein HDU92_005220 [Lobulomyces angularis]
MKKFISLEATSDRRDSVAYANEDDSEDDYEKSFIDDKDDLLTDSCEKSKRHLQKSLAETDESDFDIDLDFPVINHKRSARKSKKSVKEILARRYLNNISDEDSITEEPKELEILNEDYDNYDYGSFIVSDSEEIIFEESSLKPSLKTKQEKISVSKEIDDLALEFKSFDIKKDSAKVLEPDSEQINEVFVISSDEEPKSLPKNLNFDNGKYSIVIISDEDSQYLSEKKNTTAVTTLNTTSAIDLKSIETSTFRDCKSSLSCSNVSISCEKLEPDTTIRKEDYNDICILKDTAISTVDEFKGNPNIAKHQYLDNFDQHKENHQVELKNSFLLKNQDLDLSKKTNTLTKNFMEKNFDDFTNITKKFDNFSFSESSDEDDGIIVFNGTVSKPTPLKESSFNIQTDSKKSLTVTPTLNRLKSYNSALYSKEISATKKNFRKNKEFLSSKLFKEFNESVFDNKLPKNLEIFWSKTLQKTAGRTHTVKKLENGYCKDNNNAYIYSAKIELSEKVLDDEDKLKSTLVHEMCHVAAWLINKSNKPPHGEIFKYWGNKVSSKHPNLKVTTCHSYKIEYKYQYECQTCFKIFGRHSKSIDVEKFGCGEYKCGGRLILQEKLKLDGTPVKKSLFTVFMKENFKSVKKANPNVSHGEIMRQLSKQYKDASNKSLDSPI